MSWPPLFSSESCTGREDCDELPLMSILGPKGSVASLRAEIEDITSQFMKTNSFMSSKSEIAVRIPKGGMVMAAMLIPGFYPASGRKPKLGRCPGIEWKFRHGSKHPCFSEHPTCRVRS